jgi:hypothetical protein
VRIFTLPARGTVIASGSALTMSGTNGARDSILMRTEASLSQPHFNILLNSYLVILKSVINRGGPIRVKACYIIYTATWTLFDVLCLQTQY